MGLLTEQPLMPLSCTITGMWCDNNGDCNNCHFSISAETIIEMLKTVKETNNTRRDKSMIIQEDVPYTKEEVKAMVKTIHDLRKKISLIDDNLVSNDKIYAITHRSFEFDDMGYPSLEPIKFFTTKEKRDNAFKELVTKQIEWFENCKNSKYSNPNNYEIGEETNDDFLELYMDKWCYEWGKEEYKIEE